MADQQVLTKNNMVNLVCNTCKKYLSVSPVYISNGKFICGRCEPSGHRVTIYEELAKYMIFPCIHESCTVKLNWGQVQDHEGNCPNKVIICPKHNCSSSHKAKDLYQHFVVKHQDLLCSNNFKVNRRLRDMEFKYFNKDKKVYLLHHENQSYLVMVYGTCKEDKYSPSYIESYSYYFGVFYLYKTKDTKTHYDLTVGITDVDQVVTDYSWYNEPLKEFDYNTHCLGCLDNNCLLGHVGNKRRMFLWNKIDNLKNECDFTVTYSVQLVKEKTADKLPSPGNSSIAAKLECPICYEYFSAPIYICNNGHSLCSKCKKKVTKCCLCQAAIGNSRNYALEEISETLELCCPNASKGCKYLGTVRNIQLHVSTCKCNHS